MFSFVLGSAIGSFIPAMFVTGDSDSAVSDGINTLVIVQFSITAAALVCTYLFFQDEPLTAPSLSAKTMQNNKIQKQQQQLDNNNNMNSSSNNNSSGDYNNNSSSIFGNSSGQMFKETKNLFMNKEYLKLFFGFTIVLGICIHYTFIYYIYIQYKLYCIRYLKIFTFII